MSFSTVSLVLYCLESDANIFHQPLASLLVVEEELLMAFDRTRCS